MLRVIILIPGDAVSRVELPAQSVLLPGRRRSQCVTAFPTGVSRRHSFQAFEEIGGEAQGGLTDGVFGGDDV